MRRREFLRLVIGGTASLGLIGCAGDPDLASPQGDGGVAGGPDGGGPAGGPDARPTSPGATDAATQCDAGFVHLHDTNAQALYLDGTLGPLTGVIYVDYVIAGEELTLDFWHGHGGVLHRFTLLPQHYEALKRGERVYVTTTTVDSHEHMLFIDPVDPDYRVEGAPEVLVPRDCLM
jgi:hypothetical protein